MSILVQEFHQKFGLPDGSVDVTNNFDPKLESDSGVLKFRFNFMREELHEFASAALQRDKVKAFDALLDLVYVAMGTSLFMGITPEQWYDGMSAVHEANMSKMRATSTEQSKRGTTLDVVKPEGWIPPEQKLRQILGLS